MIEMWVVLKLKKWASVRGKVGGWTAPMSSEDEHCIGFLAVYDTYEAALEDAESADLVMEIRESIRA